jgi:hypothetical protein
MKFTQIAVVVFLVNLFSSCTPVPGPEYYFTWLGNKRGIGNKWHVAEGLVEKVGDPYFTDTPEKAKLLYLANVAAHREAERQKLQKWQDAERQKRQNYIAWLQTPEGQRYRQLEERQRKLEEQQRQDWNYERSQDAVEAWNNPNLDPTKRGMKAMESWLKRR